MNFNLIFEIEEYRYLEDSVKETLEKAALHIDIADPELSLMITDSEGMTPFNEKYRGKKGETDVLSFPFDGENPEGSNYLGDIVISIDRVISQAEDLGHTVEEELMKLSVHGFLHLAGYDHQDGDDSMEKIEKKLTGI